MICGKKIGNKDANLWLKKRDLIYKSDFEEHQVGIQANYLSDCSRDNFAL